MPTGGISEVLWAPVEGMREQKEKEHQAAVCGAASRNFCFQEEETNLSK